MSIAVVANRSCGPGGGPDVEEIRAAFRAHGADATVEAVRGDELAEAARAALGRGAKVLAAAGGDGTVSCLAGVAVDAGVPFAVLPLGTLNHFAKDAGLPLGLPEAVAVAATGRVRPVDAAEVGGRVFLNNASIGLYPRAVRERERRQAGGESKPRATLGAAQAVLRRVPAHHLHLSIDGRHAERVTSVLMVGNNAYSTGFGDLGQRASLRKGILSVYSIRRPGRRAVLTLAARAILGRLDRSRDFEAHEARELTVDSVRPTLRLGIDGEVVEMPTPLGFRIRPGALRLMEAA